MTNQTEQGAAQAPCGQCGMLCAPGEFHPYAACLMFKGCHDGEAVRSNLAFAIEAGRPTPEGCTSDGWIGVDDRLPTFAEDAEDDGVKVYTWDGELVTEDEFMPEYEQPAGPAVGGWMRTGEWFASDNLHRVTHWMLRRLPAGPVAAATAKDKP